MEPRISLITLGVDDLARATAFYRRMGWRQGHTQAEGVAFFQAGGMILSLFPRAELATEAGTKATGGGAPAIVLAYNARDAAEVDRVLAEAEAAGGRVTVPAKQAFWGGYHGHFADTEGHLWEVAWNPAFPIAADGAVRLPD